MTVFLQCKDGGCYVFKLKYYKTTEQVCSLRSVLINLWTVIEFLRQKSDLKKKAFEAFQLNVRKVR